MMVPGSAADLRKHLFPSSWQEHYKLVTVGFAALQGCDEKKARKTSVFGDHYLSQSDTPPRAALKKARHELLKIKRNQFSISFGKLGPKCIILGYQESCGRCNSFHPTCEVKTRGVLVNDQLLMLATNTEAKSNLRCVAGCSCFFKPLWSSSPSTISYSPASSTGSRRAWR